jgi:hypothetical protein
MILLIRVVTAPFLAVPLLCVLLVYGEDAARELLDSYNDFFAGLK